MRIPTYRFHKARGLAVVTIDGHDHYLGQYGSIESKTKYGLLIARHAAGLPLEDPPSPSATIPHIDVPAGFALHGLSVGELVVAYLLHAKSYYRKNGVITDEYDCQHSATRPLVELYECTDVGMFGGLALQAVRNKMIERKWSRGYINKSINRIRQVFRWGVANDMFPADVVQRLDAVPPLLKGRSEARELPPRFAVPMEHIDAVKADVNEHTRDLIDLALLTGARPGELCMLTGSMLDRSKPAWIADLADHKMSHKERKRVLAFGPKAQLILRRYLKADPAAKLFPIQRRTFTANIKASCLRLGLPVWTGHWLRHNAATEIRREMGLDEAQLALGHSSSKTTEIYAHLEPTELIELALKRG